MARTTNEIGECLGFQNKFVTEVYENKWTLPKWSSLVWQENNMLAELTYEINTGKPNRLQTKWIVEFGILKERATVNYASFWKMVEMKNFKGEIEAKASLSINGPGPKKCWMEGQNEFVKAQLNENFEGVKFYCFETLDNYPKGDELTLTSKLVIKIPISAWKNHLHKMCHKKADADFLAIMKDESTADLKIITKDRKEFFAHKCILKARCPVFESMFRSNYIENHTGVVNVEDISGKTMDVLLHFFYSGQLLPSWRDPDTIVEFLYTAGKYQIAEVLEILDLEVGAQGNTDEIDEQLMDITNKLMLPNAEARVLKNINKRKRTKEMNLEINHGETVHGGDKPVESEADELEEGEIDIRDIDPRELEQLEIEIQRRQLEEN